MELDAFLKQYFDQNPNATVEDLLTASMKTRQQLVADRLEQARIKVTEDAMCLYEKDGHIKRFVVGEDPEDVEMFYKIDRSIGTTRFLQLDLPGFGNLVPAFNQDSWHDTQLSRLTQGFYIDTKGNKHIVKDKKDNPIRPQEEASAEQIIQAMVDTWPQLSEQGTQIHKVFQDIFEGKTPVQPSDGALKDPELFRALVEQVNGFKQSLLDRYPNCKFYPEYIIKSENLDPKFADILASTGNDSINGKIDLLILDENGNCHLYDFKVSRKDVGDWNEENNGVISDNE